MTYPFLHALLMQAEAFEAASAPAVGEDTPDLAAFGRWLTAQAPAPEAVAPAIVLPALPDVRRLPPNEYESPESEISTMLTFLYRYVRSYARLALAGSPLTTFDDFTYLATLLGAEPAPLTKSELIERNIQEKATGTEVIRRLLRQGFVAETPHPTDKRAKHLHLTPIGRGVLFTSFRQMSQVATLGAGPLTAPEKQGLLRLLRKLDHFHHPIFTKPGGTLEELLAQHLPAGTDAAEPA